MEQLSEQEQDRIRQKIMQVCKDIKAESDNIKPYVIICQPRRDLEEVPAQELQSPLHTQLDVHGFSRGFVHIGGEKVDMARNHLIYQAMDSGAEYMLFIGEDTVLPYDGFQQLYRTAKAHPDTMIIGVYYVKTGIPMVMIKTDDNYIIPWDDASEDREPFEVWQAGLDCALIPMKIIRAMYEQEPDLPFCCIHPTGLFNDDEGNPLPFIGEDNFFYHRLRKAGFKVLCDPKVQCLHCDLLTGKFTAHPDIDLDNYFTNFPMTERLTTKDKMAIDKRWIERIPKDSY